MRTRLLSALLFAFPLSVFAGPFGLEMGMGVEQLKGAKPSAQPFTYVLEEPPTPHSAFEFYLVFFSPETGLAKIRAVGKNIATSGTGFELRSAFDDLLAVLSAKYGEGKSLSFLEHGSIWNEPRDWMMAVLKKERQHVHIWSTGNDATKADRIKAIVLSVSATSNDAGYIAVDYEFENYAEARAEMKRKENEAL